MFCNKNTINNKKKWCFDKMEVLLWNVWFRVKLTESKQRGETRGGSREVERKRWTTIKVIVLVITCHPFSLRPLLCECLCRCVQVCVSLELLSFLDPVAFSISRAFVEHWAVTNRLPGTMFSTQNLLRTTLKSYCGWFNLFAVTFDNSILLTHLIM